MCAGTSERCFSKRIDQKTSLSEQDGLTQITLIYYRPAVKQREEKSGEGLFTAASLTRGLTTTARLPGVPGAIENTLIEIYLV